MGWIRPLDRFPGGGPGSSCRDLDLLADLVVFSRSGSGGPDQPEWGSEAGNDSCSCSSTGFGSATCSSSAPGLVSSWVTALLSDLAFFSERSVVLSRSTLPHSDERGQPVGDDIGHLGLALPQRMIAIDELEGDRPSNRGGLRVRALRAWQTRRADQRRTGTGRSRLGKCSVRRRSGRPGGCRG